MKTAAEEYKWKLNYGGIALMWRGGCIIRSAFLNKIKAAYDNNPFITNLLLDSFFADKLEKAQNGWRNVVSVAAINGIPLPAISAALGYFDGYRCENLPANLLQAQRDYFGAHTMNGLINREVNSFIRTGQDEEGVLLHQPITHNHKTYFIDYIGGFKRTFGYILGIAATTREFDKSFTLFLVISTISKILFLSHSSQYLRAL